MDIREVFLEEEELEGLEASSALLGSGADGQDTPCADTGRWPAWTLSTLCRGGPVGRERERKVGGQMSRVLNLLHGQLKCVESL